MIYLGHWGGEYVYQPEYDPATWESERFPPPQVHKCACCKIKWFRRVTVDIYDGLCHVCYKEEFEGEPDIEF